MLALKTSRINELNCMFQVTSLILWPHWTSHHLQYGRVGEGLVYKKKVWNEKGNVWFNKLLVWHCINNQWTTSHEKQTGTDVICCPMHRTHFSHSWSTAFGQLGDEDCYHARKVVRWLSGYGNKAMRVPCNAWILHGHHKGYILVVVAHCHGLTGLKSKAFFGLVIH